MVDPKDIIPVVRVKPARACELHSSSWVSRGSEDTWRPSDPGGTRAGTYSFWDDRNIVPGWWPKVYRISFNANVVDAVALTPPVLNTVIRFGFRTGKTPASASAGVPPRPEDIIYSDNIPTGSASTGDTPTIVNTNFGNGWIVPQWDGRPGEFFIELSKGGNVYGATASILWGYEEVGGVLE